MNNFCLNEAENLVKSIGEIFIAKNMSLATAESCTGGGLSFILTSVPGASSWFTHGFVTYSNKAKETILGVPSFILNQFGAVSKETASSMADGALQKSGTSFSIAITGVAGPSNDSSHKPIGTVWFAFANKASGIIITKRKIFAGNRASIRMQSILFALKQIKYFIYWRTEVDK